LCSGKSVFACFERTGGQFEQMLFRRMPVLPNKGDRIVRINCNYYTAPRMHDNIAVIFDTAVRHAVTPHIKNLAFVNSFGRESFHQQPTDQKFPKNFTSLPAPASPE